MKPLIADVHMHSIMSGHAYGTIRELAQAASERGLQLIGITEHGPAMPGTCHPIYFLNLVDAPRVHQGVELLYGSEVNLLKGGKICLEQQYMRRIDYAVLGIHNLCYENQGITVNTDELIAAMADPVVRFISHPDDSKFPLDYPALMEAAKHYDVALEMNNSSLRKPHVRLNCRENLMTMLPMCAEKGVKILVNTDSHDPDTVGDFSLAERLLKELNFPDELIVNNDLETLKAFLKKR